MYQKLLFDLDGTLTDPKEGICKSVQYALHACGIEEPDIDVLEPFIGPPLKDSFIRFYQMTDSQAAEAIEKYRERFSSIGLYENKVYPGILELLQHLQEAGYELAVASSKPTVFVKKILKHFDLDKYFVAVVGSELNGTRVNKDEVIEEALRQLFHQKKVQLEEVIMIGDRRFDIEGAQKIGVTSVGVTYGYAENGELQAAGADHVVRTVKQLEKLLLSVQSPTEGKKAPGKKSTSVLSPMTRQPEKKQLTGKERSLNIMQAVLDLFLPLLIYYLVSNIVLYFLNLGVQYVIQRNSETGLFWIFQHAEAINVVDNSIAMLVGVFFIRRHFLQETLNHGEPVVVKPRRLFAVSIQNGFRDLKKNLLSYLPVAVLALSVSITLNIFAEFLQVAAYSRTYTDIANAQYSVPLWLGLILYGIISPVVEEIVFRGVLFRKCRKYMHLLPAVLLSSLCFGLLHGNLIQGVYAFLMGAMMAVLYESYRSFLVPVLFHAIANIGIFVITHEKLIGTVMAAVINCVIFSIISISTIIFIWKRQKKLS